MDFQKTKNDVIEAKRQSDDIIRQLKDHEYWHCEDVVRMIHRFVLLRFLLTAEDTDAIDLKILAEKSVEKSIQKYGDTGASDNTASCEGVTSAVKKKILLLMAIQRELGIRFPADKTADLNTTVKIGVEVFTLLEQKK